MDPPSSVLAKVSDINSHYDYISDRQYETIIARMKNKTAEEESEYSCPSDSEEESTPFAEKSKQMEDYDMASDGSLFAGKKSACSGAAYAIKNFDNGMPLVRKMNIPPSRTFAAPGLLIKEDIQNPSSTSAEIAGLRFLLTEQKEKLLKSMTPMVHAIDSMAAISAITKDGRSMSARDKLREANRRDVQAVRLLLEELGFYSEVDHPQ
ncbi:hypothetical protein CYMTET_41497 [Cymbomonas tetramitiformis]|uniref:Uncharacterized protein n=1 Tax=Cymbomonas tetramitiformis TaxID=36881 RepID=A0AAE0C7Q5_9CHLO|nr:hypothetical protein CYMTET_41497 [Cymbomonas tetramitiformis]